METSKYVLEICQKLEEIEWLRTKRAKKKDLWDELDVLVPLFSCDCEEARPSVEHLRSQRLLQFLMGLNESYSNIRSNVLAKRHVVTVNEAYMTQEESQRSLGVIDTHREPLTMLAGRGQDFKVRKPRMVCEYCGYKRHLKENCFKIIGYPADFKSKRKNQPTGGKVYTNNVNMNANSEEGKQMNVQIQGAGKEDDQRKHEVQLPTGKKSQITHTGEASILGNKTDLYSGRVMGIGRENNDLYLLKENITVVAAGVSLRKEKETELWHLRLGHASIKAMQHIPELQNKVDVKAQEDCQVLSSDNDTEFFNSHYNELLATLGIVHQSSCLYTPQQNGTVERKHRHILEIARALKFQSSVPIRFWGDCARTVIYLINKLPIRILQGKCPYEVLHGKPARIDHLRVFGCLCFASNLPGGDKFAPRARKSILIGYSETQKGYRLYDLDSKRIFVSRNVTFREHVFPFKENMQIEEEDLFPNTTPSVAPTDTMSSQPTLHSTIEGQLSTEGVTTIDPTATDPEQTIISEQTID
ncbi:uncharacterized protein [Nicotiana sylvestris]|uniref:uncharacterized protein n=1 Tax=Nicotiana sylvestris TaxID=4096 RepID=UPI00388CAAD9